MKYSFFEFSDGGYVPLEHLSSNSSVSPSQHIIHSGFLVESVSDNLRSQKNSSSSSRYFVLDEDFLWCKARKEDTKFSWKLSLKYLKMHLAPQESSRSINALGFNLKLCYASHTWNLQALNRTDFDRWVGAFTKVVVRTDLHQRFIMNKALGSGAFSKVCEAIEKRSKTRFAVKGFNKSNFDKRLKSKAAFFNEISIMKQLCHPNLLNIQEIQETENSVYFVLELCEGGRLQDFIRHQSPLTEQEVKNVMEGLLRGISYLAENKIARLELKLRNVLLRKRKDIQPEDVVLVDFNLNAVEAGHKLQSTGQPRTEGIVGTSKRSLTAPDDAFHQNHKSDVLGAGIICYIMMMGDDVLDDHAMHTRKLLEEGKAPRINFASPSMQRFSPTLIEMLKQMLEEDASKRPTADLCLLSKVFAKTYFKFKDYSMGTEEFDDYSFELKKKRSQSNRLIRRKEPMSSLPQRRTRGLSGFSSGASTNKNVTFKAGTKNSFSKREAGAFDLYKKSLLTRTTKTVHSKDTVSPRSDLERKVSPSSSSVMNSNVSDSVLSNQSGLAPGELKRIRKKSQFGQEYELTNPPQQVL